MPVERREIERWDRDATFAVLYPEGRDPLKMHGSERELRFRLAEAQNWRCCYCGVQMNRFRKTPGVVTVEHVIPESAGGKICWETCVAACSACNGALGKKLGEDGQIPLTVPLCPRCGSLEVRAVGRAVRCRPCNMQFSRETATVGLPFSVVPFRALRRVAGEIIVSDHPARKIAGILAREVLRIPYTDTLTASLMELAREPIEIARSMSDDLAEIYDDVIAVLWDCYTPESVKPPRGGFPEKSGSWHAPFSHLSTRRGRFASTEDTVNHRIHSVKRG